MISINQLLIAASEKVDPGTVGVPSVKNADNLLANVLGTVYFWAGIVCVLAIIIGSYFYVTANGDAAQVKRGKEAIIGAVAGLIVIIAAFVITQFVLGRVSG